MRIPRSALFGASALLVLTAGCSGESLREQHPVQWQACGDHDVCAPTGTAKETAGPGTGASGGRRVLDDAHTELASLEKQVRTAVGVDAVRLGVRVEDLGKGRVRCFFVHVRGDSDRRTQEQLDARQELEGRINRLLAHTSEIDASVARALRNAGHRLYASLDEAQSERAAELVGLGTELTDKQFAELNSIMRFNARDADFSTAFYQAIGGPREALEFYGRVSLDGTAGNDKARLALTRQLQRNMGLALASATDPDNEPHLSSSWGSDFRRLGTRHIAVDPRFRSNPYGYQVLGGILRYGDYDARFINPIAGHVVRLHHEEPARFMDGKPVGGLDLDRGFNPSGQSGAGYDPLTSVLQGLGHSPDAAKPFFSDENATLGHGHFDELTDPDFEWPADSLVHPASDEADHARDAGPDALGHALEAAVTGSAWDADSPAAPRRDGQTPGIMQRVVDRYNAARADGPPDPLKDSLARMGAAYIDDLNHSFSNRRFTSPRRAFKGSSVRDFMMLVAGEEDGYRALAAAQQSYVTSGLAAREKDGQERAIRFVENAAKVHGILVESRSHGIREEFRNAEDGEPGEALLAVQDLERAGERATTQPFLRYAQTMGMSIPEQRDVINEIEINYRSGKAIISDNEKVAQ
ncbi:hypothetical protein [Streptomyces sp. NPDC059906]|uniref:hypothetical protein n=1 Tax=Streptomyces sp. NPDC059906 TaxID=3346997 RepID=UPI003656A901